MTWISFARSLCAALLPALTLSLGAQGDGSQTAELRLKTIAPSQWRYVLPAAGLQPTDKVMTGTIAGVSVTVMDIDGNDKWNEQGKDLLVVGNSTAPCYVSKVANLGGKLFTIEIADDGAKVVAKPYSDATGTLDLKSEFKCFGTLETLVVNDVSKQFSFNFAAGKPMLVPAGKYEIGYGVARKDKEVARIGKGKMPPIVVHGGSTTTPKWGSTITAEFEVTRAGEEITVQPDLKFYGRGGEEYENFQPNLKSPKFLVFDANTKKLVASGRFGGCWGGGFSACTVGVGDTKEVTVTVEHGRNLFGPITGVGGKKFVPPAAEADGPTTPRPGQPKTGD